MTNTWKELLGSQVSETLSSEIDAFETDMKLRKSGKLDEKIFAETRLRRGVYGQRYDNGKRHDGIKTQDLNFPCGDLTKGPETVWDAPGMMRIKIPMGKLDCKQLEVLADIAEEYSDSILHVTTRQCIQLHFIHIEDTPDMMRRLASVGITTREACGNSVRNITACQFAGVCSDQAFDVTPYAHAATYYLLGHRDVQDFGRKFKIAFSGCKPHPCGLAMFHDVGCIAKIKNIDGKPVRGFEFYVGGGLGSVPHQAELLDDFVTEDELLPMCQAVCRVFSKHGERINRARARLKFVLKKMGIEEFRKIVFEERKSIPNDEKWTTYKAVVPLQVESPIKASSPLDISAYQKDKQFMAWTRDNLWDQPQKDYVTATIRMPLGDFTSRQARDLADIARTYSGGHMRLTVEQNIVLRWISKGDLPSLYSDLARANLGDSGAGTIKDITSCPGTDTCKLGISASRGLTAKLGEEWKEREFQDESVRKLRIKVSGCFNSCGQHHVADIGFLGVSRNMGGRRVAHFQLVVGGEWANNGGSYGLAIGAFPSKNIPQTIDRLVTFWTGEREPDEGLQAFITRQGRAKIRKALDDLRHVPTYEEDPSYYVDWGDAREYTIGDMGVGECAGEVVTFTEFGLQDSERQLFDAQAAFEKNEQEKAAELAFFAMVSAAKALVRLEFLDVKDDADSVVGEFKNRLFDTEVFHDPFAGAKFGNYFLKRHKQGLDTTSNKAVHQQLEESQLFIEAAHACYDRIQEKKVES